MSIVTATDLNDACWIPAARTCVYCGELVAENTTAVFWLAEPPILLHRDCARSFGSHLIMDSREAELASGRQPWTRRCARALGAAVVAEEVRA